MSEEKMTDRHKEVLDLLIDGNSNKVIAARLGISEQTVKNYVHGIYQVYDVGSSRQLIAMYYKAKISTLV